MERILKAALFAMLAVLLPLAAAAETCQERVAWAHTHDRAKKQILTTDVKGSGNTILEACRDADPSGEKLDVVVMLNGRPHPLEEGRCIRRFSKFLVVRTAGTERAAGQPAMANGTTRICKDS